MQGPGRKAGAFLLSLEILEKPAGTSKSNAGVGRDEVDEGMDRQIGPGEAGLVAPECKVSKPHS